MGESGCLRLGIDEGVRMREKSCVVLGLERVRRESEREELRSGSKRREEREYRRGEEKRKRKRERRVVFWTSGFNRIGDF